jgi:addiction module HigA family antidote
MFSTARLTFLACVVLMTEIRGRKRIMGANCRPGASAMSIPNDGRRTYRPPHPGEHLREDYLPDYGFTVASFAAALRVSRRSVSELLNERRGVSAEMALRLGRLFTQSPEFWLGLQRGVDLWDAEQAIKKDLARIKPLPVPPILTEKAARRLAKLGGTMPELELAPRRRQPAASKRTRR